MLGRLSRRLRPGRRRHELAALTDRAGDDVGVAIQILDDVRRGRASGSDRALGAELNALCGRIGDNLAILDRRLGSDHPVTQAYGGLSTALTELAGGLIWQGVVPQQPTSTTLRRRLRAFSVEAAELTGGRSSDGNGKHRSALRNGRS